MGWDCLQQEQVGVGEGDLLVQGQGVAVLGQLELELRVQVGLLFDGGGDCGHEDYRGFWGDVFVLLVDGLTLQTAFDQVDSEGLHLLMKSNLQLYNLPINNPKIKRVETILLQTLKSPIQQSHNLLRYIPTVALLLFLILFL